MKTRKTLLNSLLCSTLVLATGFSMFGSKASIQEPEQEAVEVETNEKKVEEYDEMVYSYSISIHYVDDDGAALHLAGIDPTDSIDGGNYYSNHKASICLALNKAYTMELHWGPNTSFDGVPSGITVTETHDTYLYFKLTNPSKAAVYAFNFSSGLGFYPNGDSTFVHYLKVANSCSSLPTVSSSNSTLESTGYDEGMGAENFSMGYSGGTDTITISYPEHSYFSDSNEGMCFYEDEAPNSSYSDDSTARKLTITIKDAPLWIYFTIYADSDYLFPNGGSKYQCIFEISTSPTIAKPILNQEEYEYTGSVITPNITVAAEDQLTITGDKTATIPGIYTINYHINSSSDHYWDDNDHTTSDIQLVWKIVPKTVTAPQFLNDSQKSFTCDGSDKTPQFIYDNQYFNVSGTTTSSEPGSHDVVFTCKDYYQMSGGATSITLTWNIVGNLMKSTVDLDNTVFVYQKNTPRTVNVVAANALDADKFTIDTSKSTLTATDVGEYHVYIKPIADYFWSTGGSAEKELTWNIVKAEVEEPTLANASAVYDGTAQEPVFNGYDSNLMEYVGDHSFTAANSYTVKIQLQDKKNYKWKTSTNEILEFTFGIVKKKITAPTFTKTVYNYTGAVVVPEVQGFDNNTMEYVVSPTAINAGSGYTIKIGLKNKTSTEWAAGGITDITFTYSIVKTEIIKPTLSKNSFVFSGGIIQPKVLGFDSNLMEYVSKPSSVRVGSYDIVIKLKDPVNSTWKVAAGKPADNNNVTLSYSITKLYLERPSVVKDVFTYNGSSQQPLFENFDNKFMRFVNDPSQVNAGEYEYEIELIDNVNTAWAGDVNGDTINATFKIEKKVVEEVELLKSEYDQNPEEVKGCLSKFDSDLYTVKREQSKEDENKYVITIALRDKDNMVWANGKNEDIVLSYTVKKPVEEKAQETNGNIVTITGTYVPMIAGIAGGSAALIIFIIIIIGVIRKKRSIDF